MKKIMIFILLIFAISYANPYSDIRLEILSKIKKLQEQKRKEKDKAKINQIENKIKNLKELIEKYEISNGFSG